MKIAIIGRGTSAIITSLVLLEHGHEIEIFYDPNSPYLRVGESTTPHIGQLLYRVLGISIGELVDKNVASFKNGVKFINWGKGKEFRHYFTAPTLAFHFESQDFNEYLINYLADRNIIKLHAEKVSNKKILENKIIINEKEYDFIVSCVGWNNEGEYKKPFIETVNSAFLYKKNEIRDITFTLHEATEDGWQFGLPFPHENITKYGYLFNRTLSNKDQIYKKLSNNDLKYLEWDQKFSCKLIQNKFEAFNGNKLFFIEPLQALSLYYYYYFAENIASYLKDRNVNSYFEVNRSYQHEMVNYQISLCFHYKYGSIFESDYWKNVLKISNNIFNMFPHYDDNFIIESFDISQRTKKNYLSIGVFGFDDFEIIDCGMKDESMENMLKNIQRY